ncbi:MAG: single-stranded DNA-binding protein [Leptospiraceae bacterium]|nr:single-stranded DNA-binding protein [Leptospiraceae bacterium]
MANDLNQVMLIGRLTQDPQLRQISSGNSVCNFSIANNRSFTTNGTKRDEVSYFNCVAWGRLGEIINQYCQKGKQIAVTGRLRQDSYTDKDGRKVYKIEVVVENMQLLGRSGEEGRESGGWSQSGAEGQGGWPPADNGPVYGQMSPEPAMGIPSQFKPASSLTSGSGSNPYQDNQMMPDEDDIPF